MRFLATSLVLVGLVAVPALSAPRSRRRSASSSASASVPASAAVGVAASPQPTVTVTVTVTAPAPAAASPSSSSSGAAAAAGSSPSSSSSSPSSPATYGNGSFKNTTTSTRGQNVLYWGQNGGGARENNDLSSYCTDSSGVDIVILSFLYQYGNGVLAPGGTIGQSCTISNGQGQGCDELAKAIDVCKSRGVKVLLSLGGAVGTYGLGSQQEAEAIGQSLWDSYGKSGGGGGGGGNGTYGAAGRPFGQTFVDGWDFDIESNNGNSFYPYLIAKLRANFASDPSSTYYITGAPQCPLPEPNMSGMIGGAQFDYLFVQFYNNPSCSVDGTINWDGWKGHLAGTPSAGAKIFIGVPAAPLGATGTDSGAKYYLDPSRLATLVNQHKSDAAFGGVMMWAAAFSDANVNNGCTYAQQAKRILTTGATC
ncbi:class III chitinase ChiA2 [Drechmeria coniospora]|uniref:Class III chitinase ChiA2 n=1 Tax=Drechmeria coniospora TaxID=98403 RepID=A0A151GJK2_DRECN|nr:class III chitinase ChiA2 [Drechmeria coniospora]KYK57284.1 class III chitinase ChiA2 [Drechmeria coniospora]ODA79176.1 hypothetical protein RJ55_04768 [Drechmeria coniospora]